MLSKVRAALAGAVSLLAVACDEPVGPTANGSNSEVVLQAFPLNGSPLGAPSALAVYLSRVVPPDAAINFDLAFDLDAQRRVVLIPARQVASGLASAPTVGLQLVDTPFDQLTRAPAGGYRNDSTLVAPVGRAVAIQLPQSQLCAGAFTGNNVFAKLVVDSVAADRRIWFRFLANTTCGYRTLTPGVPKD